MSPSPLIPQSFWFRWTLKCPRMDRVPGKAESGRLLDLPESCRLPRTPQLEGRASFSEVRAAWNPGGLALQFEVTGKDTPIRHDPYLADDSDGVQLWVDTRDTRDVHRATRFCHRYRLTLIPEKGGNAVSVQVEQKPIHRALADAPQFKSGGISVRGETLKDGWRVEVFLGSEALNGFDPENNRRLGLCYQVTDPDRGDEFVGVGRDFPIGEDPSLWATLELMD